MAYYHQAGVIVPFVQKFYKQMIVVIAGLFFASMASMTFNASAAGTVVVSGDTAAGENDIGGWLFNRDQQTKTPYEFNNDEASLGDGSLYVLPITNTYDGVMGDCNGAANPDNGCDKFIGEYFAQIPVGDLESFSYDYQVGASGSPLTDADQFYLNVYANFDDNDNYGHCVYNVVPEPSVGGWQTVTFDPSQSYPVGQRNSSPATCPAVPNDIGPAGEFRMFALNLGDTSTSDQDIDGYFDNVVVTTTTDTTTYDFEPATVTVTIDKYLDGEKATAVSANNASFPMESTWEAENLNGGTETSGIYTLSPVAYQAVTSEMNLGADYTTNEVFGATVAATCNGTAPFALVGYTTGSTVEEAESGTRTITIPAFTDLQENKYVIVWNKTCVYVTNKDQCKDGGWMLGLADGRTFKNQGDCVSYFATFKNLPAGGTTPTLRVR